MTDLSQHFTTAKLLRYTAPMAMMALMSVYGIVDGLFVSNFVGKEAFASVTISFVHTLVFEVGSVMLLPGIFGPESIWWSIVVAETAASIVVLALVATRTFRTDNAD